MADDILTSEAMADAPEPVATDAEAGAALPLDTTEAATEDAGAALQPEPEEPLPPPVPHVVQAFGASLLLDVPADGFLVADSEWRLENIYQPFLTTQMLPATGVALDIGAGYGLFGLLFAKAFPGWTVWCFEPVPEYYDMLASNVLSSGLTNVHAVNLAVGAANPLLAAEIGAALVARDMETVAAMAKPKTYGRHLTKRGSVEARATDDIPFDFELYDLPTIPADALCQLNPTLLKLVAPRLEQAVIEGLAPARLDHIVGETWDHVASSTVFNTDNGTRHTYLPRAGGPLKLRRTPQFNGRQAGLDVVVAMYNTKDYVVECVEGIIANSSPDVRALVVDDGSTDGCGDLVRTAFAGNSRVSVHHKLNGGCASARNYGRMKSRASHIAFVDADDVIDGQLFPELLELARYSGAEVVQGGFDYLHVQDDGEAVHLPSYEDEAFAKLRRGKFSHGSYVTIPAADLIIGQPTIWRRVYRRDFLDTRKIFFPEHIRAFDDQIFQLLTLLHARDIPAIDHVKYHYRQHPGQDIKQGDERFFYSLEMFRMMLKRGLHEGWNDFSPLIRSFANTINWIHDSLRPDLKPKFLKAAAELWVYMQKALGNWAFRSVPDDTVTAVDFPFFVRYFHERLKDFGVAYSWAYLDAAGMHPAMVKAGK